MADGPTLRPESTGRFWLPCPSLEPGTWNPIVEHQNSLMWNIYSTYVSLSKITPCRYICSFIQCAVTFTFRQLCVCVARMNKSKLKRAGRKLNLWTEQDMRAAVKDVKYSDLKLRVATTAYNLPLGSLTIQRRVNCERNCCCHWTLAHCRGWNWDSHHSSVLEMSRLWPNTACYLHVVVFSWKTAISLSCPPVL